MRLDIDLSKVEGFDNIPEGIYILKIINGEKKKSQAGLDKISWKAEIVRPTEVHRIRKTFWFDTSLSENALFMLKNLADACGKLRAGSFETSSLFGCTVGAEITLTNTPEYGERNNVRRFIKVNEAVPKITGKMPPPIPGASPVPVKANS